MNDFKLLQSIKSLQHDINLPSYNFTIEKIIREVYSSGCRILYWSQAEKTEHEQNNDFCRVVLKGDNLDRKEIIWDILHEFGHHLDGPTTNEQLKNMEFRKQREINAWRFADLEFEKYPELQGDRVHYDRYKKKCLKTYGVFL